LFDHSDVIWVLVNKLTPKKVENRNKEFAWRKAKPNNEMGFKVDNNGVIYCGNVYLRDKGF
jgi:hypothetical protein